MASSMAGTGMPVTAENITQLLNETSKNSSLVCYATTMISSKGVWEDGSTLHYALPIFVIQIILVMLTTRLLVAVLRPFRQPRVISEILSGIILGPSVLGEIFNDWQNSFFPQWSLLTLETIANVGLVYYLFLVGIEMDVCVIKRSGRKSLFVALAGIAVPFAIGTGGVAIFRDKLVPDGFNTFNYAAFIGVVLAVTAFPILARILAESKILSSDLGKIAMSAAIVNDIFAWVLLAVTIAVAETRSTTAIAALWILIVSVAFVLVGFYCVRPLMWWVMRRIPEGETIGDVYICSIVTGAMVASIITDAIGIHAVVGAFVFGLIIPNGPLGATLIEKLEDLVTGIILPLFFVASGLRTDLTQVRDPGAVLGLALIFIVASVAKAAATTFIALVFSMPLSDGVSLGLLMNTRGLVEIIILNVGKDKNVLDTQTFTVLVFMSVAVTAVVTPAVKSMNRPSRRLVGYKRRNLQRAKPDAELRMVACIHNTRNVPSIISLLETSNPTKRSPIFVYALHLIELTGRASAMLIVHNNSGATNNKPGGRRSGAGHTHGSQAQSEHIMAALENYEQHAGGVSVQPLTAISPFSSMHEDICSLAEDKHAALIVLPFHKLQTVDGGMEVTNSAIRTVNQSVLEDAPCSVAILVDRGLAGGMGQRTSHCIAVLFFGGHDDREALAYGWRMSEHPGISLTVVRFMAAGRSVSGDPRVVTVVTGDPDREEDEEYVEEFRMKSSSDESVVYLEKVVASTEETVGVIRSMDNVHDLYVVGRGKSGAAAEMVAGMTEWSECPELGPIGDLLASPDFESMASVIVVQQFVVAEPRPPTMINRNQRKAATALPAAFNVSWVNDR